MLTIAMRMQCVQTQLDHIHVHVILDMLEKVLVVQVNTQHDLWYICFISFSPVFLTISALI